MSFILRRPRAPEPSRPPAANRRPFFRPAAQPGDKQFAGPVAARALALLGADVLRLEPPGLPELPDLHAETGFGKRSAALDLGAGRDVFEELLATADVVVTGYRPGALDRFGLSPRALAERRPGDHGLRLEVTFPIQEVRA